MGLGNPVAAMEPFASAPSAESWDFRTVLKLLLTESITSDKTSNYKGAV